MQLSTRTRYGCRAMMELALNQQDSAMPLNKIAARQDISVKYLAQIFPVLRTAGLVRSIRGPRGGYTLARDPSDIRLSDIVHVLEGSLAPVECVDAPGLCEKSGFCATRDVWKALEDRMEDVLHSTTLSDLAENQRSKTRALQDTAG